MSFAIATEFTNEVGNEITMSVGYDHRGVTVYAEGPTSSIEHTWTPMEAVAVMQLIQDLVDHDVIETPEFP